MPSVGRGFDRLSPYYDVLAAAGSLGAIGRSHRAHLEQVRGCRRALIVGGGNGGFLRALLAAGFRGEVVCLDVSRAMLDRSARGLGTRSGHVELRHADVRDLDESEAFDLVCTQYVLDAFDAEELESVRQRIDRALVPAGLWLCADFAQPRGSALHRGFQVGLLRTLYAFFGGVCGITPRRLPPIESGFDSAGYTIVARREFACGLLWSALYRKPDRSDAVLTA